MISCCKSSQMSLRFVPNLLHTTSKLQHVEPIVHVQGCRIIDWPKKETIGAIMGYLASVLLMTRRSSTSAFTVKSVFVLDFPIKLFSNYNHWSLYDNEHVTQALWALTRKSTHQGDEALWWPAWCSAATQNKPAERAQKHWLCHIMFLLQTHECVFDSLIKHTFYMSSETFPNALLGYLHLNRPLWQQSQAAYNETSKHFPVDN